jgi:hypothetical protein
MPPRAFHVSVEPLLPIMLEVAQGYALSAAPVPPTLKNTSEWIIGSTNCIAFQLLRELLFFSMVVPVFAAVPAPGSLWLAQSVPSRGSIDMAGFRIFQFALAVGKDP